MGQMHIKKDKKFKRKRLAAVALRPGWLGMQSLGKIISRCRCRRSSLRIGELGRGEAVGTAGTSRGRRTGAIVLAVIFAVIALLAAVAAIFYYTKTAESLPGFLPGRRANTTGHDTKRGIAAIIVAVVALLIAWASLLLSRPGRR